MTQPALSLQNQEPHQTVSHNESHGLNLITSSGDRQLRESTIRLDLQGPSNQVDLSTMTHYLSGLDVSEGFPADVDLSVVPGTVLSQVMC